MTEHSVTELSEADEELVDALLDGDQRALARVISKIENRTSGYRAILAALYDHTGSTPIIGITGSPGAGKSTLVDKLTKQYRERGETVGILAVDPSSPYTGGSVLGDRIRMGSTAGDMDVFIRSMSTRGSLGGLSMATADAITALDAFGKDRIIVETVGAGQSEVDIVETADTVAVVVQPGAGDDVQLLKAGILEIGDLFVVNKADMDETARTVADLEAMIHMAQSPTDSGATGHHSVGIDERPLRADRAPDAEQTTATDQASETEQVEGAETDWTPPVIETVATTGLGVGALRSAFEEHWAYLDQSGASDVRRRRRAKATVQRLLQSDLSVLSERLLSSHGGIDALAVAVASRETDPYSTVSKIIAPLERAIADASGAAEESNRPTPTDENSDETTAERPD